MLHEEKTILRQGGNDFRGQPDQGRVRMILPGKHLPADRALLSIGGEILSVIGESCSVSQAWDGLRRHRRGKPEASPLPFDWFVLALTLLFAMRAISFDGELIIRSSVE